MQSALNLEPECPGFDACPVALCGCRWLETGQPWSDADADSGPRGTAIPSERQPLLGADGIPEERQNDTRP